MPVRQQPALTLLNDQQISLRAIRQRPRGRISPNRDGSNDDPDCRKAYSNSTRHTWSLSEAVSIACPSLQEAAGPALAHAEQECHVERQKMPGKKNDKGKKEHLLAYTGARDAGSQL
jgi:hypothetical protein